MEALPYKPKIFISHSAKHDPQAEHLISELEQRLTPTFEVLLDRSVLKSGDDWRSAIDGWIWSCDAAIMLLSEKALTSPWVTYEATLLRHRLTTNKDSFVLLPIIFPNVSKGLIEAKMKPLRLTDIQSVPWPTDIADDYETELHVAIATSVLEKLTPLLIRSRFRHDLEAMLYDTLYYKCNNEELLTEVAGMLELSTVPAGLRKDKTLMIARALMDLKVELEDRFQLAAPHTVRQSSNTLNDF